MAIDYTKRPQQPPAAPAAPSGTGKVILTKGAPKVSLTKSGAVGGTARVNLNWSTGAPPPAAPGGGFFSKLKAAAAAPAGGVDLDLGCLYELGDGRKGVIQALGNSFGALNAPPWIQLDGDDRTGGVVGGENMSINLGAPGRFRRVLIFAMIYEGAPNWAAVDGMVTLTSAAGQSFEVRLDDPDPGARMCAVAQLVESAGELVFQREVRYIQGGQMALDRAYNWGMNWQAGRK
ncbi:TerD family protein [Nakamurella sp.]|uniref:TerD family protein n=1 Tax=Nakamurella sp. TaxID=1869182 RepID=UPI003B3AEA5B